MAATRFKAMVIGIATNSSDPTVLVTFQLASGQQFSLTYDNASLVAGWTPNVTQVFMDIDASAMDQATIAAAVTVTPADTTD